MLKKTIGNLIFVVGMMIAFFAGILMPHHPIAAIGLYFVGCMTILQRDRFVRSSS